MDKSFDAELWCLVLVWKVCGHNQLLAAVTTQCWYRQTCRITIPKVGALALRLRSSEIQTTHITTRSTTGENTQRDKVKHSSKLTSAKYKTKGRGYMRHMRHTQRWIHTDIRIINSLLIPLSQKRNAVELYGGEGKTAPQALRCREVTCSTTHWAGDSCRLPWGGKDLDTSFTDGCTEIWTI